MIFTHLHNIRNIHWKLYALPHEPSLSCKHTPYLPSDDHPKKIKNCVLLPSTYVTRGKRKEIHKNFLYTFEQVYRIVTCLCAYP